MKKQTTTASFWDKERCEYCGGVIVERKAELSRKVKSKHILIENVDIDDAVIDALNLDLARNPIQHPALYSVSLFGVARPAQTRTPASRGPLRGRYPRGSPEECLPYQDVLK